MGQSKTPPTPGRIVMYALRANETTGANGAKALPAIVLQAVPGKNSEVDISVFCLLSDFGKQSVSYDEKKAGGTWHWPDRG